MTSPPRTLTSQSYNAPDQAAAPELPSPARYGTAIIQRYQWPAPAWPRTDGFGWRTCPGPCTAFHEGVDLASAPGTPIEAMTIGTVREAWFDGNYGNKVTIDHTVDGQPVTTVYAHLSGINVTPGQQLSRGDVIGWLGNTGRSYGAHLHFEVRVHGAAVDPVWWLGAHGALPYGG